MAREHMTNIFKMTLDHDLKCWNRNKIRESFFIDHRLDELFTIDNDYKMTPAVVVLYNFSDQQIAGCYNSVVFDLSCGIVVTTQTTKHIVNEYVRQNILSFTQSKQMHQQLNIKRYHVLSYGNYSYFSLNGYSKKIVDWVALHQMNDFSFIHNQSSFSSKSGIVFHFEQDFSYVKAHLGKSIAVNYLSCLVTERFVSEMGFSIKHKMGDESNLGLDWDYGQADIISSVDSTLTQDFIDNIVEEELIFMKRLLESEYDIKCTLSDMKVFRTRVNKRKYRWD